METTKRDISQIVRRLIRGLSIVSRDRVERWRQSEPVLRLLIIRSRSNWGSSRERNCRQSEKRRFAFCGNVRPINGITNCTLIGLIANCQPPSRSLQRCQQWRRHPPDPDEECHFHKQTDHHLIRVKFLLSPFFSIPLPSFLFPSFFLNSNSNQSHDRNYFTPPSSLSERERVGEVEEKGETEVVLEASLVRNIGEERKRFVFEAGRARSSACSSFSRTLHHSEKSSLYSFSFPLTRFAGQPRRCLLHARPASRATTARGNAVLSCRSLFHPARRCRGSLRFQYARGDQFDIGKLRIIASRRQNEGRYSWKGEGE